MIHLYGHGYITPGNEIASDIPKKRASKLVNRQEIKNRTSAPVFRRRNNWRSSKQNQAEKGKMIKNARPVGKNAIGIRVECDGFVDRSRWSGASLP
jgi:hypothetical protein